MLNLKNITLALILTAPLVISQVQASSAISFSELSGQSSSVQTDSNNDNPVSFSEIAGANEQNDKPVINFGENKSLDVKPKERIYIAEFTLSPQGKEMHSKIQELIKKGKIIEAKNVAKAFYDEVNDIKKGNVFLNTRSSFIEIEYIVALMDLAQIDMIMGENEAAALKTQEMFSLIEVFRNTYPIDFFMAAPIILDSMWDQGFVELADRYTSVVYPMCRTYFGDQAVSASLKIHEGLAKIIRWKKRDEGLIEIQEARDQYANQIGLASVEYIESLYANALAYKYLNDFKSVGQVLDFAMKEANMSVIKKYPLNPVFGKIYMLYGETELNDFKHKDAINHFSQAVEFYKESTGGKSVSLAEAYRKLATALKYNNDFQEAVNNAVRAIDIIRGIYGEESVELVSYYMSLGGIYADWEKPKEGIEAFEVAKKLNEKHRGPFNELNQLIDSNIKYLENVSSYRWKN